MKKFSCPIVCFLVFCFFAALLFSSLHKKEVSRKESQKEEKSIERSTISLAYLDIIPNNAVATTSFTFPGEVIKWKDSVATVEAKSMNSQVIILINIFTDSLVPSSRVMVKAKPYMDWYGNAWTYEIVE